MGVDYFGNVSQRGSRLSRFPIALCDGATTVRSNSAK